MTSENNNSGSSNSGSVFPARPLTPEECPICFNHLNNKAFVVGCFHAFCFQCLKSWSEKRAQCPMCQQTFKSIYYNIRNDDDYDEYVVQQSPSSAASTSSATSGQLEQQPATTSASMQQQPAATSTSVLQQPTAASACVQQASLVARFAQQRMAHVGGRIQQLPSASNPPSASRPAQQQLPASAPTDQSLPPFMTQLIWNRMNPQSTDTVPGVPVYIPLVYGMFDRNMQRPVVGTSAPGPSTSTAVAQPPAKVSRASTYVLIDSHPQTEENYNQRCPMVAVNNLPLHCTQRDLRIAFSRFGRVLDVVIVFKGTAQTFGYVFFDSKEAANRSLRQRYVIMNNVHVEVKSIDRNNGADEYWGRCVLCFSDGSRSNEAPQHRSHHEPGTNVSNVNDSETPNCVNGALNHLMKTVEEEKLLWEATKSHFDKVHEGFNAVSRALDTASQAQSSSAVASSSSNSNITGTNGLSSSSASTAAAADGVDNNVQRGFGDNHAGSSSNDAPQHCSHHEPGTNVSNMNYSESRASVYNAMNQLIKLVKDERAAYQAMKNHSEVVTKAFNSLRSVMDTTRGYQPSSTVASGSSDSNSNNNNNSAIAKSGVTNTNDLSSSSAATAAAANGLNNNVQRNEYLRSWNERVQDAVQEVLGGLDNHSQDASSQPGINDSAAQSSNSTQQQHQQSAGAPTVDVGTCPSTSQLHQQFQGQQHLMPGQYQGVQQQLPSMARIDTPVQPISLLTASITNNSSGFGNNATAISKQSNSARTFNFTLPLRSPDKRFSNRQQLQPTSTASIGNYMCGMSAPGGSHNPNNSGASDYAALKRKVIEEDIKKFRKKERMNNGSDVANSSNHGIFTAYGNPTLATAATASGHEWGVATDPQVQSNWSTSSGAQNQQNSYGFNGTQAYAQPKTSYGTEGNFNSQNGNPYSGSATHGLVSQGGLPNAQYRDGTHSEAPNAMDVSTSENSQETEYPEWMMDALACLRNN